MTEIFHDDLYQSESLTIDVTVTMDGSAMDLTNGSATWLLQRDDGSEALRKVDGGDITITDATGGQLTIAISSSDTSGLEADGFSHYLKVEDGNGVVAIALKGQLRINASPF